MSYKIIYNKKIGITTKYEERQNVLKLKYITIAIWLLVVGLCVWQNKAIVIEGLIPGNNAVTVSAFGELVENLRNGTDISDSVVVFCKDILDHAQVPDS